MNRKQAITLGTVSALAIGALLAFAPKAESVELGEELNTSEIYPQDWVSSKVITGKAKLTHGHGNGGEDDKYVITFPKRALAPTVYIRVEEASGVNHFSRPTCPNYRVDQNEGKVYVWLDNDTTSGTWYMNISYALIVQQQ